MLLKITMQIKQFIFNPYSENTYILYDETKQCAIIDPGCYEAKERAALIDFITKEKLTPTLFLNTHCHIDHILGNWYIAEQYKLPLHAHELEVAALEATNVYGPTMGINVTPSPVIEAFLKDDDTINFGNTELKVLFAPGHSPGSICFYNKNSNTLIGGDVLFQMSIGRTDLPGGDYNTLIKSINEKLWTLPDNTSVYCGHGPSTNIGFEKKNNPFLK